MLCTVTRWQIWRELDGGRPPGRLARRHLAGCPGCRQAERGARSLDHGLRPGAHQAPPPEPTALARPATRPATRRARWPVVALTCGLLASTALFALVYQARPSASGGEQAALGGQTSAYVENARRLEERATQLLREVTGPQSIGASLDRSIDRSIDREVANLRRDARHGLRYMLRVGGLQ